MPQTHLTEVKKVFFFFSGLLETDYFRKVCPSDARASKVRISKYSASAVNSSDRSEKKCFFFSFVYLNIPRVPLNYLDNGSVKIQCPPLFFGFAETATHIRVSRPEKLRRNRHRAQVSRLPICRSFVFPRFPYRACAATRIQRT